MRGAEGTISELARRLAQLESELGKANARIAELEAENRELRRQLEEERRSKQRQAGPFFEGCPEKRSKEAGA